MFRNRFWKGFILGLVIVCLLALTFTAGLAAGRMEAIYVQMFEGERIFINCTGELQPGSITLHEIGQGNGDYTGVCVINRFSPRQ